MKGAFIEDFEQFALSVDIVTDAVFTRLGPLVERYCLEVLRADFYEVLITSYQTRQMHPTFQTLWSNKKRYTMHIFDEKGGYTGQLAYALDKEKPLWITTKSKGSLACSDDYVDSWSRAEDLPPYWDPENISAATSVHIPVANLCSFIDVRTKS